MSTKQSQTTMLACDFCAIPSQQKLNSCCCLHSFCDGCATVGCFDQEGASVTACSFCPRCAVECRKSAGPVQAAKQTKALKDPPSEFLCPITLEVMVNPVVLADGFTYEREAIEDWMARNTYSPMTGARVSNLMIPNTVLRVMINEWRGTNGL